MGRFQRASNMSANSRCSVHGQFDFIRSKAFHVGANADHVSWPESLERETASNLVCFVDDVTCCLLQRYTATNNGCFVEVHLAVLATKWDYTGSRSSKTPDPKGTTNMFVAVDIHGVGSLNACQFLPEVFETKEDPSQVEVNPVFVREITKISKIVNGAYL